MKSFIPKILVALAVIGGVAMAYIQTDKYLRIRAVEGCSTATRYQYEDKIKGVLTIEPMQERFEECMKRKGY